MGILSLRMVEADGGTARWTVSQDSSKEGTGEDSSSLAGVKTSQPSSWAAEGQCCATGQCSHRLSTACHSRPFDCPCILLQVDI